MSSKGKTFKRRGLTKAQKKDVQKLMLKNMETKHVSDVSGAWDYVGDGALNRHTLYEITDIEQGSTARKRNGNQVRLHKLLTSHCFRINQSTAAVSQAVRVLLVQSRGGVLTDTDFPDYWQPVNTDIMIPIRDSFFNLATSGSDYSTGNAGQSVVHRLNYKVKAKDLPALLLTFDDAIASSDRPVYLYMIAESIGEVEYAGYTIAYFKDV